MTARQQSSAHTFAPGSIAGISAPSGVIPMGATLPDGRVVVFTNGAESVADVYRTVFHELFHLVQSWVQQLSAFAASLAGPTELKPNTRIVGEVYRQLPIAICTTNIGTGPQ